MLKSVGAPKGVSKLDLFLFLKSKLLDEVVYRGIEIVSTFLCCVLRKGIHDQELKCIKYSRPNKLVVNSKLNYSKNI